MLHSHPFPSTHSCHLIHKRKYLVVFPRRGQSEEGADCGAPSNGLVSPGKWRFSQMISLQTQSTMRQSVITSQDHHMTLVNI